MDSKSLTNSLKPQGLKRRRPIQTVAWPKVPLSAAANISFLHNFTFNLDSFQHKHFKAVKFKKFRYDFLRRNLYLPVLALLS